MNNKSTSWGKVAKWYNTHLEEGEDTYQEKLIKPNLLRLLNVQAGENVLDVGCGQGFFAREIARLGAKVTGIDVGPELIDIARDNASDKETYFVCNAERMTVIKDAQFDAAICVLAMQNMKNMQAAVVELSRALKKSGRALIVLNHPAFRIPTASSWNYDEKQNIQYRRIDKYMSEISQEVDMTQGETKAHKKIYTYSYHHPLQVFFKAFNKAGLGVTRLEEWTSHKVSDKGARKKAEDLSRKEIPLFMCLELKKI